MKVDFMIIGAQKCATTTLFEVLNTHPYLVGCKNKEPHFFSTNKDWKKNLAEYHKLYDFKEGKLAFEGSTTYTFAPHRNKAIWNDLYEYNPEMKFIYMVRNPKQRLVSAYMHAFERGYTETEIVTALRNEPYFMDVTRYGMQVDPFIEKFGADKVMVIDFDDFNKRRTEVMEKVSSFLGIDPNAYAEIENVAVNVSLGRNKMHKKFDKNRLWHRVVRRFLPGLWSKITDNTSRGFDSKPVIPAELEAELIADLEPDIVRMEELLSKELSSWRVK